MFSFSRMITSVSAALALASVSSVLAVPVPNQVAPLASRAVSIPSPAFVVYSDRFVSADVLPPVDQIAVRSFSFVSFLARLTQLMHRVSTSLLSPSSLSMGLLTKRVLTPPSPLTSRLRRSQSTLTPVSTSSSLPSVRRTSPPRRVRIPSARPTPSRSSSSPTSSTVLTSTMRTWTR